MFKEFVRQLEQRSPVETLVSQSKDLFQRDSCGHAIFSQKGFSDLLTFLEKGEPSYQAAAVQAGVRWSSSPQKVLLRNAIVRRGFRTPSCLWAYRETRGHPEELFRTCTTADMGLMQIILLKETDPSQSIPFLIDSFLAPEEVPEEVRHACRLSILRLLDSGVAPSLVSSLRTRYPKVEVLHDWRPGIPGRSAETARAAKRAPVDFHSLVRSIQDMEDLSSLTRAMYLAWSFYIPLKEKEWASLWLCRTDQLYFQRLIAAGIVRPSNGGLTLSPEPSKQALVRKFLFESYPLAKESVCRNREERLTEERRRRVRSSELDRQALNIVPDGIICVNRAGLLYYMNPAAEAMLSESNGLRERLFGTQSLEDVLKAYSKERLSARIRADAADGPGDTEVFGDRISLSSGGKRFEIELRDQVVLLRDTTDRYLIDQEVGKLYRHEMTAALDVMAAGLAGVQGLIEEGDVQEATELLRRVEEKRVELSHMLEERIDFIRLHSDAFRIRSTEVNLNLVVDRCIGNYREAAATKGVEIESNHLTTDAVMVRGEERFLARALDNIIRNAVKFSHQGSKITLTVGSEGAEGFVRVRDSGVGIPPENLGKIFRLGFTTGGTGRGLYLARRIAVAHRGRIDVASRPDQGSVFTLRLPHVLEA